jgi:hypothetical protein
MVELLTVEAIAGLFETTRREVQRWREKHAGFPQPVERATTLGRPCLYDKQDVIAWAVLTGRWDEVVNKPTDDYMRCRCCDRIIGAGRKAKR